MYTYKTRTQRNIFIDTVRGIAIFLVVVGHSLQYGEGIKYLSQGYFYDNIFFKIIYSFHMPLFMLISGYLFYFTINNHSISELIIAKIKRLLIPIFAWNITYYLFHFAVHFIHHQIIMNEKNDH